ncbi:MAG: hypothetical protein CV081_02575 [Nitrospira sp. LK265]|nr:hypothetical protein [Nitrospira sp.]NGZ59376.1 hypothetical protein [Nitrospira sp. LK265]
MNRWLQKFPTLVWTVVLLGTLLIHAEPSEVPDIWLWSWLRVTGLAGLCLLIGYCVYALQYPPYLNVNNYLTYLLMVSVIALEGIFRVRPDLIPGEELIQHASKSIRKQYAISRGYMTEEVLSAEPTNGLIYHFHPNGHLTAYPHVELDADGYRNPPMVDGQGLTCVLLGDSLTLALDAREDVGALLRQRGYPTRNLGMFGYAPQQYRDVYKRFVIDRQVSHRYVLIFLFAGNDVVDAQNYERVRRTGGDFKEYLPQMRSIDELEASLPVMVSVARGLPRFLKSRFVTNRERIIRLPYRTVQTGELMPPSPVQAGSEDWYAFVAPLADIIAMARAHGAVPIVYLLPSAATVYSTFDATLRHYDRHYEVMVESLRSYLCEVQVAFYDLQERLRGEMRKRFIFAHEKDYHLNILGVQQVAYEVIKSLEQG